MYGALAGCQRTVHVLFVYGFAKSNRDNLDELEQAVYRKAAKELLTLTDAQIEQLHARQALVEVKTDGDETTVSI